MNSSTCDKCGRGVRQLKKLRVRDGLGGDFAEMEEVCEPCRSELWSIVRMWMRTDGDTERRRV